MSALRQTGFTLIEVLVAVVVMAIMSLMAWQGVDGIVRSRDGNQVRLEQTLRLETVIAQWEQERDDPSKAGERAAREAAIQSARSRIHQIEFWGERVSNKLGFKVAWRHGINKPSAPKNLGGEADLSGPWTVSYWFGGWDGDLLVGYMRGSLSFPFIPEAPIS